MNNLTKFLLIVLIFFCFYSCKDKETPIGELEEISIDLKTIVIHIMKKIG